MFKIKIIYLNNKKTQFFFNKIGPLTQKKKKKNKKTHCMRVMRLVIIKYLGKYKEERKEGKKKKNDYTGN